MRTILMLGFLPRAAAMDALCFLLIVSEVMVVYGAIDVDTINRKTASAVCFRDTDTQTLEMNLYVDFGGNEVDRVLALTGDTFVRSTDGSTNEDLTCTMSDISLGYVKMTSRIDLFGSNHVNKCGARRVGNTNDYKWVTEVRALYSRGIYVGIDRRYSITCSYDSAVSKYATTQLSVYDEDERGFSTPINPINSMSVLRQAVTNGPFLVTDTVSVGQPVKLQVASRVLSTRTAIDIYGLYPFSCSFGPLVKSERTPFILNNGCPNTTNDFDLVNGFKYVELLRTGQSPTSLFKTETDTFVMIKDHPNYPNNDFYYLNCYVGYCYGNLGSDARCTDFCGSNRAGRKKRSSVMNLEELDQVSIAIRVVDSTTNTDVNTPDNQDQSGEKSEQLPVIIASSVATVVFLIILLIVAVMLWFRQGFCNHDDRLYDSSSASSGSTSRKDGPMIFVSPNPIPLKA